ncbi:4-alpha-glucanotransferase [Citrifermentans bremense]|uniref:4-alpha-glucanotransferase n=1 Tax=Citrifermentans bremense TaxID=60035 RepID=UPI00040C97E7|nr:4-alpha-glucanotransferase [Citrifermentans bremense]
MKKRGSGILCHITSLPSPFGIGDFGAGAYGFADFLCEAKQSYWQILPLNPTNKRYFDSPFSSLSSCAGNTALISPELLAAEGLLTQQEVEDRPRFPEHRVDYQAASRFKRQLFQRAHTRFQKGGVPEDYARFCRGNSMWLEDHALFTALSDHLGNAPLTEWPQELINRNSEKVQLLREELWDEVELEKFLQYLFFKQWHLLKNYCNGKGIRIIGDFPMFMNYDAVDIWTNPELFKVDERKKPYVLAGSPPDAFSAEGQLFNCAVYDWDGLKRNGFNWWIRRFHYLFRQYDFVRIDHFRGLISYWEVPAGEQNGLRGSWQQTPTQEFFNAMLQHYPLFPVIAEDLGTIGAEVRETMARHAIPGMKVLLLGFQKEAQEKSNLPHLHPRNSVAYTGTHDTATVTGWYHGADDKERQELFRYLGRQAENGVNWELIRLALRSVAHTAVIQMQDVLGAGGESRMNTPGKAEGNWEWRIPPADLGEVASRLAEMTICYGRTQD